MKKIIATVFGLLSIVAFQSCSEDFLDHGLQGEVEETKFMQNETDAIWATNACYNALRRWRYYGGFPVLDMMSDDTRKGSNPGDGLSVAGIFDNFTFNASTDLVANWYADLYLAVKRTNVVIERAGGIDMDAGLKNRLIAEARFIRAMTYFKLVRLYGGVPLVTSTAPERILSRSSKEEVYNLVVEDLLFAIDNLPEQSDYSNQDIGRATKGAAKALLSKVYLYQNDFSNTEKYALEVINSGQYSLDPDYANVHDKAGEFGPGSIFEVGARPFGFGDGGHQYGETQGTRGNPNNGWGFNRPTLDLYNAFEPGDPRRDASIIELGETVNGETILGDPATPDTTYDANDNVVEIEYYNQKVNSPGSTVVESWDYNVRVLRLADILLIAAEAANELGKPNDALTHLNKVRERARGGNPNILPDITETNKDALRDIILHERQVEMAMEQNRFFDLVRTGNAVAVLGPLGFVAGKHELLPMPQAEIDLSEGALEQNPNW